MLRNHINLATIWIIRKWAVSLITKLLVGHIHIFKSKTVFNLSPRQKHNPLNNCRLDFVNQFVKNHDLSSNDLIKNYTFIKYITTN